jgi:hypothetical protein
MASDVRLSQGQNDFSDGVDSSKVPTIQSSWTPKGLRPTQVAWGQNLGCRGGGLLQRLGWQPLCTVHDGTALYQGGLMYDAGWNPAAPGPYLMLSIGGRMYQVRVDTDNSVHDVTGAVADPATAPQAYFCQGDRFMVKQAGDGITLPLFWDGVTLRRSIGITNPGIGAPAPNVNQIPAATAMVFYQNRIWYARNTTYAAGDIMFGAAGTAPYGRRDAILNVTESPLAFGGDGFSVPSTAGNVRALSYPIDLDATLGEGTLFIFTPKAVYSQSVPKDRTTWISTTVNNQPIQRVVMRNNGGVSDRSVVAVNGDLFYQSLDPAIRSYFMALRYFQTWGNTPISNNIQRVLQFNDRSLMRFAWGIEFGSRLWMGIRPVQTPVGVACQMVGVLDLDPLSTLQDQQAPTWDGVYEGLDMLQAFTGDFGGRERAFAVVHSRVNGSIQVWEMTDFQRFDQHLDAKNVVQESRVEWYVEFPAIDWSNYKQSAGGGPYNLKQLDGMRLYVDKVFGTVDFAFSYRPDYSACWVPWHKTQICAARTSCEDANNPVCYPLAPFREQYRAPIDVPPPTNAPCVPGTNRPADWGFQFQIKVEIKGWCRIRGYELYGLLKDQAPFAGLACADVSSFSP